MDSPFDTVASDSIIQNGEPFNDGYTPDEIIERDSTIEEYRKYLQPILTNGTIHNIFIRGPTGVGKTAITKRILEFLKEDAISQGVQFDYSYLNVRSQSSYESLLELTNKLSTEKFVEGTNTSRLRRVIYDAIDDVGEYYLLVIDECDKLDDKGESSFLYEFPRARSNGRVENTQVGVIGISNNLTYGNDLDPRITSSLTEREIEFAPYDALELKSLLKYYCELALREGAYTEGAINYMAGKIAKDTGDARNALDLLELSVQKAENEQSSVVEESHVQEAWGELDKRTTIRRIDNFLTSDQKVVLAVLTLIEAQDQTPVDFNTLYPWYEQELSDIGEDPRHDDKVRDHLHTLAMYGFIEQIEQNSGPGGGRRFVYSLDIDTEHAIEGVGAHDLAAELVFN